MILLTLTFMYIYMPGGYFLVKVFVTALFRYPCVTNMSGMKKLWSFRSGNFPRSLMLIKGKHNPGDSFRKNLSPEKDFI